MAVLTITATDLGPELIAGIPQLVGLETNLPATIYFTLDGSDPTVASPVYIQVIQLPTLIHIRLRALAISGPDQGTLDITFYALPNIPHQVRGTVVDAYGIPEVVIDGYGPDEQHPVGDFEYPVNLSVRGSDLPLIDLETKYSKTGFDGIGPGTLIPVTIPIQYLAERESEIDPVASSPNNNNVYFNPRSQFIVIDGRDGYQDQSVYIINRPMGGTMDESQYLGGKSLYEASPYISGSLVRQFYNYEKGIGIFYYYDNNECRWIKSIQKMEETLPSDIGIRRGSPPFVFAWMYNKRSMI